MFATIKGGFTKLRSAIGSKVSKAKGIAALFFLVAGNFFSLGMWFGNNTNDANQLFNQVHWFDNAIGTESDIDYLNCQAIVNYLKQDKSQRIGFAVFTQKSIYLAPNLDPRFEFVLGVVRKEDGQLMLNYGFRPGLRIKAQ